MYGLAGIRECKKFCFLPSQITNCVDYTVDILRMGFLA